jgi:osmoprotectant transport system substrate-binding protein
MFSATARRFLAIPLLVAILGTITACSDGKEAIRVSSKEFTEQLILGQITVLALENAGYKVDDKTGIAGSNKLRTALLHKDIDVYWEYTGTGWLSLLQHDRRLANPQTCYESVRDEDRGNGVTWLNFAAVNNTYTIMMQRARAEALGIHSVSDLAAKADGLKFAVDHEFTARPDGLPGLQETYGLHLVQDKMVVMDNAIIYRALKDGQVDVGMGFATDGRILAFDLVNLKDDLGFFPAYNPAPVMLTAFAEKHKGVADILNSIAAKLTDDDIVHMNYLVDIQQRTPKDVAKAWLDKVGMAKP